MKKIKIIGLTGQSGAGKSTVSEYFLKRNIAVINADLLVSEIYNNNQACITSIASVFGKEVLDENGKILRPVLAKRVFSSKDNTKLINSIVHPFVMSLFVEKVKQAKQSGAEYIVYDAPQLFESNADVICDYVISVVADKNIRINRLCSRDNINKDAVEMRLNAQLDEEFFRENSDYIIENNSDIDSLITQTERVFNLLCKR